MSVWLSLYVCLAVSVCLAVCLCLLLLPTEATIYREIMQNMKNATKQLNTSAWHRRRAEDLSAAASARRSTKIGGGGVQIISAAAARRGRRRALYEDACVSMYGCECRPTLDLMMQSRNRCEQCNKRRW